MSNSFFYTSISTTNQKIKVLLEFLNRYADEKSKQIFVIDSPLGEKKYVYNFNDAIVILTPKCKILFLNFGDSSLFDEYCSDFLEDLGHISDKYGYINELGRLKNWSKKYVAKFNYTNFSETEIREWFDNSLLLQENDIRHGELLISLLTGSINNIENVGGPNPVNLLDKIKKKIVLYDADQTRFIYTEPESKEIIIQGLAGTGKTELLLHKLKELYTDTQNYKIAFTCFNKVLEWTLKSRIPEFFDFMKVDEQIRWNDRLWVMRGWGSEYNRNSGIYAFICNHYKISFYGFNNSSFSNACTLALNALNNLQNIEPYFDYMLIDESQDFPVEFFELCKRVTKNKVYIAGDIFQNIFDFNILGTVTPHFLLNKCYRTDPRTLMFAHALGMGVLEETPLRLLTKEEWEACGYNVNQQNNKYFLTRKKLRRFEELDSSASIELITSDRAGCINEIISIIELLRNENPTIEPDDIAVVFLRTDYQLTDILQTLIKENFDWESIKGYEAKRKAMGKVFLSNKNNIKGLEFPYVICVINESIARNLRQRNSIYMMLTRSFLKSYVILTNNSENIVLYKNALTDINQGYLVINQLSNTKETIFEDTVYRSLRDISEEILDDFEFPETSREAMIQLIETRKTTDPDEIRSIVKNYLNAIGESD